MFFLHWADSQGLEVGPDSQSYLNIPNPPTEKDLKCTWEFRPHVQTGIHKTENKQLSLIASQKSKFLIAAYW